MPSQPTRAGAECLLSAAMGVALAAGATRPLWHTNAGRAAAILGVMPLLAAAGAIWCTSTRLRAEIDTYRAELEANALRDTEARRAEIEGAAFGLALELWRTGQLSDPGANVADSETDRLEP